MLYQIARSTLINCNLLLMLKNCNKLPTTKGLQHSEVYVCAHCVYMYVCMYFFMFACNSNRGMHDCVIVCMYVCMIDKGQPEIHIAREYIFLERAERSVYVIHRYMYT